MFYVSIELALTLSTGIWSKQYPVPSLSSFGTVRAPVTSHLHIQCRHTCTSSDVTVSVGGREIRRRSIGDTPERAKARDYVDQILCKLINVDEGATCCLGLSSDLAVLSLIYASFV